MGYTYGIMWTDELIKEKLFEVIKKLGLNRMPSKSEIVSYYGDNALGVKLTKSGGFAYFAKLYNLDIKESTSQFGMKYEKIIRDMLIEKGNNAELTPIKFPYDILVNNRVKIDVKVGRIVKTNCADYYTFNLEKSMQTCDLFIIITLNKNECVRDIYVIPSSIMNGKTQLSIGINKSKYDKFINRWDFIKLIDNAFEKLEIIDVD